MVCLPRHLEKVICSKVFCRCESFMVLLTGICLCFASFAAQKVSRVDRLEIKPWS